LALKLFLKLILRLARAKYQNRVHPAAKMTSS
jgi:hypothetical protein